MMRDALVAGISMLGFALHRRLMMLAGSFSQWFAVRVPSKVAATREDLSQLGG